MDRHNFASDNPINTKSEDFLGRSEFAISLAENIIKFNSKDNLVIGLYGNWGTGKTSLLHLIEEHIKEKYPNNLQLYFNPWNFSDQNQLIKQFFNVLSNSLQRKDKSETAKSIGNHLSLYSKIFQPLKIIPGIGNTFAIIGDLLGSSGELIHKIGEETQNDLESIKNSLSELLASLKYKIIIFLDDLDRLNNQEIKQIFQLIKILADFPNIVYVLAFDRNVVVNALSKVQEGKGEDYLEKIVQVPIEIPEITNEKVYAYLDSELNSLQIYDNSELYNQTHWGNIFHSGIKNYFRTIRDVNRFFNVFRFIYSLLKDEVNRVDLIAITVLKIFEPVLYNHIKSHPFLYAGNFNELYKSELSEAQKSIEIMLKSISEYKRDQVKNVLLKLFPKLDAIYGIIKMHYADDVLSSWSKESRICSPEYFYKYFTLNIEEEDISNQEINKFLSLKKLGEIKEFLVSIKSKKKHLKFLNRLELYTESGIEKDKIEIILLGLMDYADQYYDPKVEQIFNSVMSTSRINYQLMQRLESKEDRFKLFKKIIQETENSIGSYIYSIEVEDSRHDEERKDKNEFKYILDDDQVTEIKKIAIKKVCNALKEGKFLDSPKISSVFYFLERNEQSNITKEITRKYLTNYKTLSNFLEGFKNIKRIQSSGDLVYRYSTYFKIDELSGFIDLDYFGQMAKNIVNSKEFGELSDEQLLTIRLFVDCYEGKINPEN